MNGKENIKKMKRGKDYSSMLPDYPRTCHLPWKPNAKREDLIASESEVKDIFTSQYTYVEDKIDGASCGMMLAQPDNYEDDPNADTFPIIRNRSHILTKGYSKATAAKMQFASVWNWFYSNKHKFEMLNEFLGIQAGIYGEWLYATHGLKYDKLPDIFVAYDIYDYEKEIFLETGFSRDMLQKAGFSVVHLLHKGPVESYEQLEDFCQEQHPYASERREGVYVKVTNGLKIIKRFKMVRQDFIQGEHWQDKKITKNVVLKG